MEVKDFSPASSMLAATARHFSRHLRMKCRLRRYSTLQRIEPIFSEEDLPFGHTGHRTCDICFNGVISIGASTSIRFEQTNWRLRHLQFPTTPASAMCLPEFFYVVFERSETS